MFDSKIEAYLYAIYCLRKLNNEEPAQAFINDLIAKIRIAIENHRQDIDYVSRLLINLSEKMTQHANKKILFTTAIAIRESNYNLTLQARFENPLSRRFESQLPIQILLTPTPAIMATVHFISEQIVLALMQIEKQNPGYDFFSEDGYFLKSLIGPSELGFGAFTEPVNFNDVIGMLLENNPSHLTTILYIQFIFAQLVMRLFDFKDLAPRRVPVGRMLQIVSERGYANDPARYFRRLTRKKTTYMADSLFYYGPFYNDRGRLGVFETPEVSDYVSQMGLMLDDMDFFNLKIPVASSSWAPDSKFQQPDLNSCFTRYLLENDAVYVAGPSGMASLFLAQMENFANFDSLEKKQSYLAAVLAYLVAGGFHSIHEVLGPAEFCLGLIPGYAAYIPEKDFSPPPPDFHQFYASLLTHDPDFKRCYEQAWFDLDCFFEQDYLPMAGEINPALNLDLKETIRDILGAWLSDNNNQLFFEKAQIRQIKTICKRCHGIESTLEALHFIDELMTAAELQWVGLLIARELGFASPASASVYFRGEIMSQALIPSMNQ